MVQRFSNLGLSTHHVLIFLELGGVCKRHMIKYDEGRGLSNSKYHGNG